MSSYSYIFKFITVGDSGVGKSCLLLQFSDRRFRPDHDVTIGVEFGAKTISVNDKSLKIQIWDTVTSRQAGQESFLSVTRAYYRGSVAALLVYDVSMRSSFESLGRWLGEINNNIGEAVCVILVANKVDLNK
jgi:Ras-related protein Rab-2A